ncbi:MAG: MiaB/RimO family radical SAM methylthiotransferase [Planctomycetota bacterium]
MPVFTITTLGCKVNQYDSQAVASALAEAGLRPAAQVSSRHAPDLVVVNTCCVTTAAMRKSRQAIRQAVRSSPQAAVLVVGCYADYDGDRLRKLLAGLNVPPARIFTAGHHDDLAAKIRQFARSLIACGENPEKSISAGSCGRNSVCRNEISMTADIRADDGDAAACLHTFIRRRREAAVKNNFPGIRRLPGISHYDGRQRAFVKVQDGCDAFCSYCIVPYIRWKVWSRDLEEIEDECRRLIRSGHKEIVLCGIFLGAFGRGTAVRRRWGGRGSKLAELLRRVAGIAGLWRVRLSSLEPADMTAELLAVCRRTPQVAPHFHLPLQSGSARMLRRMNRQYTPEEYRETVKRLKECLDRPAVTTDVVVGFPGENDADFQQTLGMARHCGFAKIHAFPFSPVAGTTAWTYRGEAPPPGVIRRRMAELAELEALLAADYRRKFVGETMEGLVEQDRPGRPRERRAMTDRYQPVFFEAGDEISAGDVVSLKVTGVRRDGLSGAVA